MPPMIAYMTWHDIYCWSWLYHCTIVMCALILYWMFWCAIVPPPAGQNQWGAEEQMSAKQGAELVSSTREDNPPPLFSLTLTIDFVFVLWFTVTLCVQFHQLMFLQLKVWVGEFHQRGQQPPHVLFDFDYWHCICRSLCCYALCVMHTVLYELISMS